jgi:hypothetical protein
MKRPPPTKTAPKAPGVRVKADWCAIKEDALKGMQWEALGRKHGLSARTIKERAAVEDWPVPARLERAAREIEALKLAIGDTFSGGETLESLSQRIDLDPDGVEKYKRLVFALCAQGMRHFSVAAPIPKGWREFEILDRIARRAAGLDNEGVANSTLVNVSVLRMDRDPVVEVSATVGEAKGNT